MQFDCDSHPSLRRTLNELAGGNIYQIKNVQTGKCLTIAGGVSTDNNDCGSHPSGRWTIRLKLEGGRPSAAQLDLAGFDIGDQPFQRWRFIVPS